ncbi:hypothetical protein niasHS_005178 [Heterodera schachtii]|uniref:Integrase catalytic domain-containing protein n=1 Tax=Heterodera schachtii TaxID=97005 RepID=A0ABD2JRS9_HETSC
MIAAFEKIFKKAGVLPNKLYSDAGLEFQAKKMTDYWKQKDIIKHVMYSPHLHAGVVERANRTLKERLYKYFSEKNTKRWIDALDSIVRNLNSSANRTTGLKPVDVNFKNAAALRNRLYKQGELSSKTPKFKAGDIVRISKEKGDFSKGYFPNFTDELFRISKVNPTDPPSYRIRDQDGEDIRGIFYEQELAFLGATTSANYSIVIQRIKMFERVPTSPFELVNERTREKLALMKIEDGKGTKNDEDYWLLMRRCSIRENDFLSKSKSTNLNKFSLSFLQNCIGTRVLALKRPFWYSNGHLSPWLTLCPSVDPLSHCRPFVHCRPIVRAGPI